eukprot:9557094-Lingulodinium_polyedra.AAC.1
MCPPAAKQAVSFVAAWGRLEGHIDALRQPLVPTRPASRRRGVGRRARPRRCRRPRARAGARA